ncbi:unnamed protein product [Urochloa decumbens]|uniref:Myb-like domain-containing protein n=1 Tax=Urochloa decumbens TaxID=240449 RepID=A0ABC8XZ29_9POAL
MDDVSMEIQLLMAGPANEANLYQLLGDTLFDHNTHQVQVGKLFGSQYPYTSEGGTFRSRKDNDHWTEDEMVELIDGVSKKGVGKWNRVKDDHFSMSIHTSIHLKDKWRNLVRACMAKNTSKKNRKAKNTSEKKVNAQKATKFIVKRFGDRILAIQAKHLAQKRK